MSTRSCIARIKGDGFEGVYHHWDGHPSTLGATLYHWAQRKPLDQLLRLLIDTHPAGWSTINGADLDKEAGYFGTFGYDPDTPGGERNPCCYCHGDRSEEANPVTHDSDMGMEYAYVFDEHALTMAVLERVRPEGEHATGFFGTLGASRETGEREDAWAVRAVVELDGPEPDWTAIECGPSLEHCDHYRWKHDPTICRQCDGDRVFASQSHQVGYGAGCDGNCIPEPEAPEALRHGQGEDYHIVRPEGGFACDRCGGSGKEPIEVPV